MMHVFYCTHCKKYRYTNNKTRTLCCEQPMRAVDIDFKDFTDMNLEERRTFLQQYAAAHFSQSEHTEV